VQQTDYNSDIMKFATRNCQNKIMHRSQKVLHVSFALLVDNTVCMHSVLICLKSSATAFALELASVILRIFSKHSDCSLLLIGVTVSLVFVVFGCNTSC